MIRLLSFNDPWETSENYNDSEKVNKVEQERRIFQQAQNNLKEILNLCNFKR